MNEVGGCERIGISCPSREERQRLVDLLQKQMSGSSSTVVATSPYVSCRLPYRTLTRFLASLIKTGLLTPLKLREILDGSCERQRRLILGCTLLDPLNGSGSGTSDLSRFRRRCKVECHLATGTGNLRIDKELTLGVPFLVRNWSDETASSTTTTGSASDTDARLERCASLDGAPLSYAFSDGLFHTQSLPCLNLCTNSTSQPADQNAVSHFSFDSGLADVEAIRSQSPPNHFNQTQTVELSVSPVPSSVTYRSTLYAHWWLKAKVSASAVHASSPPLPAASPGKTFTTVLRCSCTSNFY